MSRRACATADCKAAAMAGSIYCHAHNPASVKLGGAPAGNRNAAKPGSLYSKVLKQEEIELFEAAGETSLEGELKLARLQVARLLEAGNAEGVNKALLVVAKLVGEHRKATGDQAAGIVGALTAILEEFGLGDGLSAGLN